MWVGLGIFLIVVGAILSFAIDKNSVEGVNLEMIGYIMMGGGVLALLMSLIMGRRPATGGYESRTVSHVDPNTGTRVDEHRVDGL